MKRSIFTISQALLLMALNIPVTTAEARPFDYFSKMKDGTLYIRTDVVTGGTGLVELIDSSTRVVVGVSSFDGTKLKAGQKLVLEQIRFGTAEVAASGALSAASQAYSTKYADCPVPLRGANLIIKQGGVTKIDIPVERLLSNGSVEKNVGQDGYYLQAPCLLEPELETTISIRFPDASAAVAYTANKKQFVEVLLIGPEASVA